MNVTTVYSPRVERISPFLYKVGNNQVDMRDGRAIDCTCRNRDCQHQRIANQSESIYSEHNTPASCVVCGYQCRARNGVAVCWKCSW